MSYTIIEYEFSQHRSAEYAKAGRAVDAEVLFAGSDGPGDSSYTWELLPTRRYLALRTALGFSHSKTWIVVRPTFWQLAGICRLALGKSVKIEVWLDESQDRLWFGVALLRAAGFEIATKYTQAGLAELVAGGASAKV